MDLCHNIGLGAKPPMTWMSDKSMNSTSS